MIHCRYKKNLNCVHLIIVKSFLFLFYHLSQIVYGMWVLYLIMACNIYILFDLEGKKIVFLDLLN